jgi:4'-phosphopantetheinyl transferase
MITLLYYTIDDLRDKDIDRYLRILPDFMQAEVKRYKYVADQKLCIVARLMLYRQLIDDGRGDLIFKWERACNNKPYIRSWRPFNISHSGEMVVFSTGSSPLGIDIEKKLVVDYPEMIGYFHPSEQEYIMRSNNTREAFYEIWVKKEALLKAMGTGIINGLKKFNCTNEMINYQETNWYFQPLSIHPDYTCYLSFSNWNETITVKEFNPEQMLNCEEFRSPQLVKIPGNISNR